MVNTLMLHIVSTSLTLSKLQKYNWSRSYALTASSMNIM